MPKQGIIDLGSNTIRLVVYELGPKPKHAKERRDFKTLVNEKKVCGLSAYVKDDVLSEAGVEKAIDVVSDHLSIAHNIGCHDVRIFATAVIRNRANSGKIVKAIEKAVGEKIDLISGEEEAHLGFVGASLDNRMDSGILIDIGGGSTELTLVRDGHDAFNSSLDVGCVTAFADCVKMLIPTAAEMARISGAVERRLDGLAELRGEETPVMYGIGGSIRAVGRMRARMQGSDKPQKVIGREEIASVFDLAESDPSAFIHTAAMAVPDRMHTILTGCTILRTVMQRYGAKELRTCKYGIREGFLMERC